MAGAGTPGEAERTCLLDEFRETDDPPEITSREAEVLVRLEEQRDKEIAERLVLHRQAFATT